MNAIRKLHAATTFLNTIPKKWPVILKKLKQEDCISFSNSKIDLCFATICHQGNLQPLFTLWKKTSWRACDISFMTNYAQLIFVIYKGLVEEVVYSEDDQRFDTPVSYTHLLFSF